MHTFDRASPDSVPDWEALKNALNNLLVAMEAIEESKDPTSVFFGNRHAAYWDGTTCPCKVARVDVAALRLLTGGGTQASTLESKWVGRSVNDGVSVAYFDTEQKARDYAGH